MRIRAKLYSDLILYYKQSLTFLVTYSFSEKGVQTLVWQNQAKAGRLRPKYLSDKLYLKECDKKKEIPFCDKTGFLNTLFKILMTIRKIKNQLSLTFHCFYLAII